MVDCCQVNSFTLLAFDKPLMKIPISVVIIRA